MQQRQRLLGIDFGGKRVGVALSDPLGLTAQPLTTLVRDQRGEEGLLDAILGLIATHDVHTVVLGLPLHLSGDESAGSQAVRRFASLLASRSDVSVVLLDERFSSAAAHRTLSEADVSSRTRKNVVDKLAAVFILQNHLDRTRPL